MQRTTVDKIYMWNFLLSSLAIMLLSGLNHFLYELMPNGFVALFAPVNESFAEHGKIVFYPVLVWWLLSFLIFKRGKGLSFKRWFTAGFMASITAVGMLISLCSVTFFGFLVKIDVMPLHLIIELISLSVAQLVGHHIYKQSKGNVVIFIMALLLNLAIVAVASVFTFHPLNAPLFISP